MALAVGDVVKLHPYYNTKINKKG